MPWFFFNIRSPDAFLKDEIGLELQDVANVKAAAIQGARDILAEDLRAGRAIDHQRFEICDDSGAIVHTLVFRDVMKLLDP